MRKSLFKFFKLRLCDFFCGCLLKIVQFSHNFVSKICFVCFVVGLFHYFLLQKYNIFLGSDNFYIYICFVAALAPHNKFSFWLQLKKFQKTKSKFDLKKLVPIK